MTAEPQIGYPSQHEGWQQTPAGHSDAGEPSGLSHAFAAYDQESPPPPPNPAPPSSFSGHDPDAPSGLSFTPPPPPAFPGEPGYPPAGEAAYPPAANPDGAYAVPPQAAYSDVAYAARPQAAYSASPQAAYPSPQAAYSASPQAAYPSPQAAYPSPQAAYPPPASGGFGAAGHGMPGYLQPYGVPGGPRGKGPGVGPVVGFTFFFGPFGAISAARRADRARAVGDSTGKYWIAFGATLVGCWVLGAIFTLLAFAMSIATDSPSSKSTTAIQLQQSIVQQGTFTDAAGKAVKVKSASCVAKAVAGPNGGGVGTYTCALGLADGTKDTVLINLDSTGRWRVVGQAK